MLKAFKSVLQILVLGFFRLPIRIWLNSKNRLIAQYGREESIYDVLDDEYMATNWLDWAVDCGIFMIYPIGFSAIITAILFTQEFLILLAIIPLYFSTIFISIARELGGSLMLLHINVKKIEKYIKNN